MRKLDAKISSRCGSGSDRRCLPLIINHVDVKNIVSKSGISGQTYAINPYVGCQHACRYCYAQFMSHFSGHIEPWGRYVDVKHWKPIANPHRYDGSTIFLSSVTDPYQPIEATEMRTRAALEQHVGTTAKISVTTKSDLVLRDLDLLQKFDDVTIAFSLNTLDDTFRSDMDDAASVARRIDAMRVVHDADIRTSCFVAPIFPGITDVEAIVDAVSDRCDEIWYDSLNMRDVYKSRIMEYIERRYQTLLPLYKSIYDDGDRSYWDDLIDEIKEITDERGMRCECGDGLTDDVKTPSGLFTDCHDDGCDDGTGNDCYDTQHVERNGTSCGIIKCFFSKERRERGSGGDDPDYNVKKSEMTQLAANLFNYNS